MNPNTLLQFLAERQRHCRNTLDIVVTAQFSGGLPNQCFNNAFEKSQIEGISIVSGWLVHPFDTGKNSRQFTQHWWNFDNRLQQYVDFSPNIEVDTTYLVDSDIAFFAALNFHRISSCVPCSVLLSQGQFYGIRRTESGHAIESLPELVTEALFAPYLAA